MANETDTARLQQLASAEGFECGECAANLQRICQAVVAGTQKLSDLAGLRTVSLRRSLVAGRGPDPLPWQSRSHQSQPTPLAMPPPGQKKPNPQKASEKKAKEAHKLAVANGTFVEKKVCARIEFSVSLAPSTDLLFQTDVSLFLNSRLVSTGAHARPADCSAGRGVPRKTAPLRPQEGCRWQVTGPWK